MQEDRRNGIPYRPLGSTGESVSLIGIGGWHIGQPDVDEKLAVRIVREAVDAGVNFMDNCWDYHDGTSEKRMGKALRDGYRDRVFLMTKIDGRSKKDAARQLDESLTRLGVDMIDLPAMARRGIRLHRSIDPEITYTYFNMRQTIGGEPNPLAGLSTEKIALRRAIAMAYNVEDQIRIIRKGQAVRAHFPIPPGIAGHDPQYRSYIPYAPQVANALLDRFGYKRGADGYRTLPDGDCLLDVEVTSNRGDCLCHVGCAREVAAMSGGTRELVLPQIISLHEIFRARGGICPKLS